MKKQAFLLALALGPALLGQTFTGSIGGRVSDPGGLAVPAVKVTVSEESTHTSLAVTTNGSGDYKVAFLKPGDYTVRFQAAGFKESVEKDLRLQINQQMTIDTTLQIGSVSESVEVSATATQLNLVSPEIAHVVDREALENMPLVATSSRGRSPLLAAKILPGVSSTSPNNSNINNFSFGGGRPATNEILVDGLPTTNPSDATYTLTPSPDAVQEFTVVTTPFSAEFGHTGGGVMMLTSRTGTNALRGSAYDYFRNRLLNARNFFSPFNGTKYVQNDPGATLGGPVVLPHYDGRNKTFFFADFNTTLSSIGDVYSGFVPTGQQAAGDFSRTFSNGQLVKIYDPATTQLAADQKTVLRDPFPNNQIPSSRFDPVGAKILSYYPKANIDGGTYNYAVHPPKVSQVWQWLARADHNFSSNDRMFVRVGRYSPNQDARQRILNEANNDNSGGWRDTQVAISETHVFGPRLFNDFRAGFVQEQNYRLDSSTAVPQLGLKGVPLYSFPLVSVAQMIPLGASSANRDRNRSYVFNEALTFQNGRHSMRMGGDYRRQMWNSYDPGKLSGSFSFGPTFSGLPGNALTGSGIADLLLGYPAATSIKTDDYTYRFNINSASLYFQDDFKITSKLTLNFGLRWEYDGPYSEANGYYVSFDPAATNSQVPVLKGDVIYAKHNGAPDHFTAAIHRNFLPRIGFAWAALSKTVIRGGYGMYRMPNIGYAPAQSLLVGPVSPLATNTTFASNNYTPVYQLANGVPPHKPLAGPGGLPVIPATISAIPSSTVLQWDPRDRTPYNQAWNIGIQRQFGGWLAEVDYQGNKGTKLPIIENLNQLHLNQFGPLVPARLLARPYPQYAAVLGFFSDGNSTYHSLQASLNHRWKGGFLTSFAYTFSKAINDVDALAYSNGVYPQDAYNLGAEKGIAGYDVPQRFVANYAYKLPIGRSGQFLNSTRLLRDIVDGWQVAGITEFQAGVPLSITQSNGTGGFTLVQRPNRVADGMLSRGDRTLQQWFNTSAFTPAPAYTLGNAPRFPIHGPGINNWDLSIMRNFHFGEKRYLQFRAELYDAFNHPNFSSPNSRLGDQNYGRITGARDPRLTEFAVRLFF